MGLVSATQRTTHMANVVGAIGLARTDARMSLRYAVFGQPIAHSLSPRIHALFAAQFGLAIDYRAIEVGDDDFAAALAAFAREGGRGANVTLPLKERAFALCTTRSERAQRCGSVNTLLRDGAAWRGDSTDGVGLLRDLRARHGFDPRDRRILLLGAGGAARAAAFALADAGAADLMIANRTPARAQALAAALGSGCAAADGAAEAGVYDLILNASAAGHSGAFVPVHGTLAAHTACYDLSYGAAAQPFLAWARGAGAAWVSDGLGMLVEQAAESFALWHHLQPDTAPVLDRLHALA